MKRARSVEEIKKSFLFLLLNINDDSNYGK